MKSIRRRYFFVQNFFSQTNNIKKCCNKIALYLLFSWKRNEIIPLCDLQFKITLKFILLQSDQHRFEVCIFCFSFQILFGMTKQTYGCLNSSRIIIISSTRLLYLVSLLRSYISTMTEISHNKMLGNILEELPCLLL